MRDLIAAISDTAGRAHAGRAKRPGPSIVADCRCGRAFACIVSVRLLDQRFASDLTLARGAAIF